MKALSVRQPWAWLIVNGWKDVENRTRRTTFRGQFLVHASKTINREAFEDIRVRCPYIRLPAEAELETGGIVGAAFLTDCVDVSVSEWFTGPWGWTLQCAIPLPFLPYRGRLGFFPVHTELEE